jgi:hypothetical protein
MPLVSQTSGGLRSKEVPPTGSNPVLSANFAVPASALTPTETFNHTVEAMWPKQPRLYASGCVFSKIGERLWTPESNAGLKLPQAKIEPSGDRWFVPSQCGHIGPHGNRYVVNPNVSNLNAVVQITRLATSSANTFGPSNL